MPRTIPGDTEEHAHTHTYTHTSKIRFSPRPTGGLTGVIMTPIFQNQKITQWVPWDSDSQTAPGIGYLTTDFLLSSIHLNSTEESALLRYQGSMKTKTDINPSPSRALILVRKETIHTSNTTGHIWVVECFGGGSPKPKGVRQQGGWAFLQRKSEKTSLIQEGQQALLGT